MAINITGTDRNLTVRASLVDIRPVERNTILILKPSLLPSNNNLRNEHEFFPKFLPQRIEQRVVLPLLDAD